MKEVQTVRHRVCWGLDRGLASLQNFTQSPSVPTVQMDQNTCLQLTLSSCHTRDHRRGDFQLQLFSMAFSPLCLPVVWSFSLGQVDPSVASGPLLEWIRWRVLGRRDSLWKVLMKRRKVTWKVFMDWAFRGQSDTRTHES
jgi:hypothetical protein